MEKRNSLPGPEQYFPAEWQSLPGRLDCDVVQFARILPPIPSQSVPKHRCDESA